MSIDISLLPRADLPVIWDAFKTQAEAIRTTAETLTVNSIAQKEEMALARKTRLTLREIRIAVEHKRVELGEGHLKEIQKVNGAAKALREFIEPLEARLLVQESFAERAEQKRIADTHAVRYNELCLLRPGRGHPPALGAMSPSEYLKVVAEFTRERDELEAANRLRVEAESRLAAQKLEMELREVAIREENKRQNDKAERVRAEQEAKHRTELAAQNAIRNQERVAAEQRRQADLRIEREKTAVLEAELAQERAAKVAEEKRLRDIEVAPDVEKLRDFAARIQAVGRNCPALTTKEAKDCFGRVVIKFNETLSIIQTFCRE